MPTPRRRSGRSSAPGESHWSGTTLNVSRRRRMNPFGNRRGGDRRELRARVENRLRPEQLRPEFLGGHQAQPRRAHHRGPGTPRRHLGEQGERKRRRAPDRYRDAGATPREVADRRERAPRAASAPTPSRARQHPLSRWPSSRRGEVPAARRDPWTLPSALAGSSSPSPRTTRLRTALRTSTSPPLTLTSRVSTRGRQVLVAPQERRQSNVCSTTSVNDGAPALSSGGTESSDTERAAQRTEPKNVRRSATMSSGTWWAA